MLGDAVHHPLEHQPSSVGQVSSPLSAHQILEFCESDLFPETTTETLQDSEVASTSNGCCYEDHSSYTTNISSYPPDVTKSPPATDLIVADNSTTTTTKLAPTTTNDANNNFSIIFDDDQEITDNNNDIDSVNLDFPTCHHPNLDEPAAYHFEPQEVEQFDLTLFENQMQILQTTDDHHCNMMNPPILPYTHHPHPNEHVVPVFGQTAFPPNYVCQDDYVSSSMPPSKLMQLNNRQSSSSSSSPNCSFMDPSYLSRNSNPPALPLEDLGIFNANLFLGELQAADNTGGIFCPDTLPRSYNTTNELQAHSYESQHLVHINGSGSCTPLASEITSLEADTYRVTNKLTTEERKEKINRYMKKRNQRNFTKKIKYACRKTLADSRPRVRGRFAKNDEFGDNVNNRTTCCISNLEEDTDHEDVKSYHVRNICTWL